MGARDDLLRLVGHTSHDEDCYYRDGIVVYLSCKTLRAARIDPADLALALDVAAAAMAERDAAAAILGHGLRLDDGDVVCAGDGDSCELEEAWRKSRRAREAALDALTPGARALLANPTGGIQAGVPENGIDNVCCGPNAPSHVVVVPEALHAAVRAAAGLTGPARGMPHDHAVPVPGCYRCELRGQEGR